MLEMMQDHLIAQIHGAMVEASAVDGHQQQVAKRQLLVFLQLTEAGVLPAPVKVWVCLELLRAGAAFPIAQGKTILGVPIPRQGPAVMHAKHPLTANKGRLKAAWLAVAPLLRLWVDDVPGQSVGLSGGAIRW